MRRLGAWTLLYWIYEFGGSVVESSTYKITIPYGFVPLINLLHPEWYDDSLGKLSSLESGDQIEWRFPDDPMQIEFAGISCGDAGAHSIRMASYRPNKRVIDEWYCEDLAKNKLTEMTEAGLYYRIDIRRDLRLDEKGPQMHAFVRPLGLNRVKIGINQAYRLRFPDENALEASWMAEAEPLPGDIRGYAWLMVAVKYKEVPGCEMKINLQDMYLTGKILTVVPPSEANKKFVPRFWQGLLNAYGDTMIYFQPVCTTQPPPIKELQRNTKIIVSYDRPLTNAVIGPIKTPEKGRQLQFFTPGYPYSTGPAPYSQRKDYVDWELIIEANGNTLITIMPSTPSDKNPYHLEVEIDKQPPEKYKIHPSHKRQLIPLANGIVKMKLDYGELATRTANLDETRGFRINVEAIDAEGLKMLQESPFIQGELVRKADFVEELPNNDSLVFRGMPIDQASSILLTPIPFIGIIIVGLLTIAIYAFFALRPSLLEPKN